MRKIKWGVMGTAFICERSTFPGMLQAENCEMYAIAGRNMEKAERFKETYGFQKAYGSYEKLLADPNCPAANCHIFAVVNFFMLYLLILFLSCYTL